MTLQEKTVFVAMELSNKKWKLVFGDGSREREKTITARDTVQLFRELATAKEKLGLPTNTKALFGYEAGRDGFWIARMIQKNGGDCHVMDPASIEVPRRARIRKTDRLDSYKLLKLLIRKVLWGEASAYAIVRVPSESQEDEMRLYRERERLVKEQTGHVGRIKSLLALHGSTVKNPVKIVAEKLRDWAGKSMPEHVQDELRREQERLVLVKAQIKALEAQQAEALKEPKTPAQHKTVKLSKLKALGPQSAWILSHECFGWRVFANRRQLGSFAGLAGTPYDSGDTLREQGISKAGSGRFRTAMIELAWNWVRWQPGSALTTWFVDRFIRSGTSRSKRKGIVALARKLLIALWKYMEQDIVPEGAMMRA